MEMLFWLNVLLLLLFVVVPVLWSVGWKLLRVVLVAAYGVVGVVAVVYVNRSVFLDVIPYFTRLSVMYVPVVLACSPVICVCVCVCSCLYAAKRNRPTKLRHHRFSTSVSSALCGSVPSLLNSQCPFFYLGRPPVDVCTSIFNKPNQPVLLHRFIA